ncbi:MAG: hypothetical protein KF724_13410 [Phycisphaeraceae bacterium]|nr:hypothetical protein [Phycisphaeraceae bacterium]
MRANWTIRCKTGQFEHLLQIFYVALESPTAETEAILRTSPRSFLKQTTEKLEVVREACNDKSDLIASLLLDQPLTRPRHGRLNQLTDRRRMRIGARGFVQTLDLALRLPLQTSGLADQIATDRPKDWLCPGTGAATAATRSMAASAIDELGLQLLTMVVDSQPLEGWASREPSCLGIGHGCDDLVEHEV